MGAYNKVPAWQKIYNKVEASTRVKSAKTAEEPEKKATDIWRNHVLRVESAWPMMGAGRYRFVCELQFSNEETADIGLFKIKEVERADEALDVWKPLSAEVLRLAQEDKRLEEELQERCRYLLGQEAMSESISGEVVGLEPGRVVEPEGGFPLVTPKTGPNAVFDEEGNPVE